MGDRDRDRYQSNYDRNQGRYENREENQYERGSRDRDREDAWRSQDRPRSQNFRDYEERSYGSSYAQDRDYGRFNRDYENPRFGREYGSNAGRNYGQDYETNYGRDYRGNYGQDYGTNYGRDYRGNYGQDYGTNYGRDYRGNYGQDYGTNYGRDRWDRAGSQERYAPSNWGNEGRGQQHRDRNESFGQQLRDAGQQMIRKVKRAFRGPKGYKRSDDRIREDVNDRLAQQDQLDPTEVEVSVANSEVTLIGSVESRHEKFLAEEIADDVAGVTEVHNQLRVGKPQTAMSGETSPALGAQPSNESSRNRNARAQ